MGEREGIKRRAEFIILSENDLKPLSHSFSLHLIHFLKVTSLKPHLSVILY